MSYTVHEIMEMSAYINTENIKKNASDLRIFPCGVYDFDLFLSNSLICFYGF